MYTSYIIQIHRLSLLYCSLPSLSFMLLLVFFDVVWKQPGIAKSYLDHHHHYYLSSLRAYTAAMKPLHPCLSVASLWMEPQLCFISTSTVLQQVIFGRQRFHFHSGVQWIATLVMELASLHSICPIQCHCFLVIIVSIFSCWHHAKKSSSTSMMHSTSCSLIWCPFWATAFLLQKLERN